jgi:hypothetical protein
MVLYLFFKFSVKTNLPSEPNIIISAEEDPTKWILKDLLAGFGNTLGSLGIKVSVVSQ